jgi:hypothetical protein
MTLLQPTDDYRPEGNGTIPGRRLRQVLDTAVAETGLSMKDLTVLAVQNDPYRVYGEAGLRDGRWFANQVVELNRQGRPLHLRGFHYAILSREAIKPNGSPYTNTDRDWTWLQEKAADAARWLGLVPFEQIVDQRNAPAKIFLHKEPDPVPHINVGISVHIPDVDDIVPAIDIVGFTGTQPYRLVLFGEKSSLEPVLRPVVAAHQADLYLPTGEISDTLLHQMARTGSDDGRPMVVFCFSDCDPAGWQMPISISRKLQALKDLEFPDLEFQVRRVALTPDQVRAHGLPSSPLKDTERRADAWVREMGVAQTEVDALAELQPDLLRRMARDALRPFFDTTLAERVSAARHAWVEQAQTVVDTNIDGERLERIRAAAAEKLGAMRADIDALNAALHVDADDFDLPDIVIPEPEVGDLEANGEPLIDSGWSYSQAARRLIASKAYRLEGEGGR